MSTWAVIPVKPLRLAKSRLAEVLSPEVRQQLAEAMLRHVLSTVRSVPQITGTLVISRDNRALALAREYGAKTVQESGAPELNTALMRATAVIESWGSHAMLILPADLPLIAPEDINGMIKASQQDHGACIVITTDRNQDGTNALYVRPPGLMAYGYGIGSYQRHVSRAREAGASVYIYESERLLQDIDLPEDIETFSRMTAQGNYQVSEPLAGALEQVFIEYQRRSLIDPA